LLASGEFGLVVGIEGWVDKGFMHLWFIYYLLIISVVTYAISRIRMPDWVVKFQAYASFWVTDPKTLLIVPTILLAFPVFLDEAGRIRTSTSLVPDIALLGLYALFFWFGSLLFSSGKDGLDALAKRGPVLFAVGFVASQVTFALQVTQDVGPVTQLLSIVASFYLAFGVIGVFLRLVKTGGRVWAYLTRTSYWVYLVHLPIVFVALRVLAYLGLPALVTAFIAFVVSVAISLGAFELLVRKTPLAKLV
jgi:peptidoglycan/LPS O-acetylase OafA/YrhL